MKNNLMSREKIADLASNGDLLEAAKLLLKHVKMSYPTQVNEVRSLMSSINILEKEYQLNRLRFQEYLIERNKLAKGLLYIMDNLLNVSSNN